MHKRVPEYALRMPSIYLRFFLHFLTAAIFAKQTTPMEASSGDEEVPTYSSKQQSRKADLRAPRQMNPNESLKETKVGATKDDSLYKNLEKYQIDYEMKRAKKVLSNLDKLFASTTIKVQEIKNDDSLGPESITDLHHFLTSPHKTQDILRNLKKLIGRKLSQHEKKEIIEASVDSFPDAVRTLWMRGHIGDKKAQSILLKNSPMSSKEIVRLVDVGACRTEGGYLVQVRTGNSFGNPVKLFDEIQIITKKIEQTYDAAHDLPRDWLNDPIRPELFREFDSLGTEAEDLLSDARAINEIRKHLVFVINTILPIIFRPGTVDFRPNSADTSGAFITASNFSSMSFSPNALTAILVTNHYFADRNASLSNAGALSVLGLNYWGSYTYGGRSIGWWLSYGDDYLGAGGTYTVNFDQGTKWSNGQPTYLSIGATAGGWRDYMTGGVSLMTMLSRGIGIGASISVSVSRSHDVTYKGEYPMDGRIPELRGLHKIEIDDQTGISNMVAVAANFSATSIPLTVAFRAGSSWITQRIYRTHADIKKTRRMLSESEITGVLFLLGKKIKESRLPNFEHPQRLQVGDEFIETKTGILSGGFVLGLESLIPIPALRVGGTIDITAEFELGIRKLPNQIFEVSIKPKKVYEIGIFGSILNILGAGKIKSMSLARKQMFIFDFNIPDARLAYFDLVRNGKLPLNTDIEVQSEDRGPEYLLTEFRAQNELLKPMGIARTFLEQIRVATSKNDIGLNTRIVPAILDVVNKIDKETRKHKGRLNLRFEGIDREFMQAQAQSVATNGVVSVRRKTYGGRLSKGQGFSGRYNQDLFVTHRRVHTIDESSNGLAGNKWQFDSLLVHGQLEDTVITGNEENKMAEKINQLFSTFIGCFEERNSRSPRLINLERDFSVADLYDLTQPESFERIPIASRTTRIDQQKLLMLLNQLKNKHPDRKGLMVKQFIETSDGLTGFAAIHQLLGAKPEDLIIRTESGYGTAILAAKKFITLYSEEESDNNNTINLIALHTKKNQKAIKTFYDQARENLRNLNKQLRLLYDDRYLIDEKSPLIEIYGKKKVDQLVAAGVRQDKVSLKTALSSSRKVIAGLLDLKGQGFSREDRLAFYNMAGKNRLRLQDHAQLLLDRYSHIDIQPGMTRKYLRNRLSSSWETLAKIDKKIKKIEEDDVMKAMDKEHLERTLNEFYRLRDSIARSICLTHLDEAEMEELKRKVEARSHIKLFHRNDKDILVDGALAQTFCDEHHQDIQMWDREVPIVEEIVKPNRRRISVDLTLIKKAGQ